MLVSQFRGGALGDWTQIPEEGVLTPWLVLVFLMSQRELMELELGPQRRGCWPAGVFGVGSDEAGSVDVRKTANWVRLPLQEGIATARVEKHGWEVGRDATQDQEANRNPADT